jgi:hypothetical protein
MSASASIFPPSNYRVSGDNRYAVSSNTNKSMKKYSRSPSPNHRHDSTHVRDSTHAATTSSTTAAAAQMSQIQAMQALLGSFAQQNHLQPQQMNAMQGLLASFIQQQQHPPTSQLMNMMTPNMKEEIVSELENRLLKRESADSRRSLKERLEEKQKSRIINADDRWENREGTL